MRQWDIHLFPHPCADDPHPGVIVSHDSICANDSISLINVLLCRTVRPPSRKPKSNEVYLNEADGLNWKTLVKCDFIFVFHKSDAGEFRGQVCAQHISEIRNKVRLFF